MNRPDSASDWLTIEQKLKKETKATLIETLKELTAELWVYALESAAGFMRGMGMHDLTYQNDLTELAWECVYFLGDAHDLYPLYEERLQTVCGWLNEAGGEWLSEPLYQLEAEMDGLSEDI